MIGKNTILKNEYLPKKEKKPKIGILSYPNCERNPNTIPLGHLIDIINEISPKLFIILGESEYPYHTKNNKNRFFLIKNFKIKNQFLRIFKELFIQIKICSIIIKVNKKVKTWIFFIGGDTMLFPMIVAKILGRKVVLLFGGSTIQVSKIAKDKLVFALKIQSKINCIFSDRIILYSKIFIKEYNLDKWSDKISIAHEHIINFSDFKTKIKLENRNNVIGYVGRFGSEKGIYNLLDAIPQILKSQEDLNFVIIGDGREKKRIERFVFEKNLQDKVKIHGWVAHKDLPRYLNDIKLLVLPSYSEGLPNIILESMACGTPVLANRVGAITDIVKDGETGFLMNNNLPESISINVKRVLNCKNLVLITKNAEKMVKTDFTFQAAACRFSQILKEI